MRRLVLYLAVLAVVGAACAGSEGPPRSPAASASVPASASASGDPAVPVEPDEAAQTSCDPQALDQAVAEIDRDVLADLPIDEAVAALPMARSFAAGIEASGIGPNLARRAELTVLVPADCAFAALDDELWQAVQDQPNFLFRNLVLEHVLQERLAGDELDGEHELFFGDVIRIDGTRVAGQADVVVADLQAANATIHLLDAVVLPEGFRSAAGL